MMALGQLPWSPPSPGTTGWGGGGRHAAKHVAAFHVVACDPSDDQRWSEHSRPCHYGSDHSASSVSLRVS